MPLLIKSGGAGVYTKGTFVKSSGAWNRRRMKVKVGGAWVDANVRVEQFAATKTRTYYAYSPSIVDYNIYMDPDVYLEYSDTWEGDTILRQGRWYLIVNPATKEDVYTGDAYGTLFFGSGVDKPTALSSKVLLSARIYIMRDSSRGSGDDPITMFASTLTDVPDGGAHTPNGDTSGSGSLIATLGLGEGGWFNLPLTLAAQVVAGKCLCIYSGSSYFAGLYGVENSTYKPKIELTYY